LWALVIALLLLTLFVASWLGQDANVDAQNAAAVLTLVTAGAVGIERLVEVLWTVVGMSRLGNWWPLKPIGDRLDTFITQLNTPLNRFYEEASAAAEGAIEVSEAVQRGLATAPEYLTELEEQLTNLKQLEPGSAQARAISSRASRAVVGLKKLHPELTSYANDANRALAGVNEFVQTFEDNPARRLMSIYAGAILGLLFAGVLGLDAIQATLGQKPFGSVAWVQNWLPNIGIAATGLVIGLGASPAHEIIKVLKETKERRKAEAQNTPSI